MAGKKRRFTDTMYGPVELRKAGSPRNNASWAARHWEEPRGRNRQGRKSQSAEINERIKRERIVRQPVVFDPGEVKNAFYRLLFAVRKPKIKAGHRASMRIARGRRKARRR